jgi:alpha-glucosidase
MTTTEPITGERRTARGASWWRDAVIYQVYIRSFGDADGDGMGDMEGIRSRLGYIRDLGVDAIWLNPFYPSPQKDAGYDVSDYRDVDPRFGTLADFDMMLAEAHALGLKVIVDVVPNHTSSEHVWFRAALATRPGSTERGRYLFRNGRGEAGDQPPNNWMSVFGGPAWTRVIEADGSPGQWYLHLFDASQPDLDWTNPEVRSEFESVLQFWLDRGVDGFRIDVAHGLAKDPAMPDVASAKATSTSTADHPHWDRDEIHDVYRSWRRLAESYDGERVFVAEAWVSTPQRLARYVRPDELHTAFNFNFLLAGWKANELRTAIDESLEAVSGVGAPPTWVLSNHDVTRHVTRYGGGLTGVRRARAGALLMFALPGGAYVYQGEELGLGEVTDLPDDVRQDPAFARTSGKQPGRDGCRVPLPWAGDEPSYGFGPGTESWLPQPEQWADLAADRQESDPGSMLNLYRRALAARRDLDALGDGSLDWLTADGEVLAFRRDRDVVCVVNVGDDPAPVPTSVPHRREIVLASGPLPAGDDTIPGATTVWYRVGQRGRA